MAGLTRSISLSKFGRDTFSVKRIGDLFLKLAHSRFLAYLIVSCCLTLSVHYVDARQHHRLQEHIYQTCLQQEKIKQDANLRIKLLKEGMQSIVFNSPYRKQILTDQLARIKPLQSVDCQRLR